MKLEKQYRAKYPETVGETDRQFDLSNYADFLEENIEELEAKVVSLKDVNDAVLEKAYEYKSKWLKEDKIKEPEAKVKKLDECLESALLILKNTTEYRLHSIDDIRIEILTKILTQPKEG